MKIRKISQTIRQEQNRQLNDMLASVFTEPTPIEAFMERQARVAPHLTFEAPIFLYGDGV